ncbi:hypothetical protein SERLA73DRAFT_171763 [Serpula lacrymans var. lacrymans S7.3]|uniref:Amidohydrolase-related domain-containing protein n=1 Tax=Serpula lacrymans var. lacrymans (strain S7.3) TaxID=936435 RepID=F8QCM3_SERL3|nr:hypothetical protein SERLA73DRAFT_171763 [Serpula lacrymans var. lacrymans S7.3]
MASTDVQRVVPHSAFKSVLHRLFVACIMNDLMVSVVLIQQLHLQQANGCLHAGSDNTVIAFVDVNILDSTGREPYPGDVLVRGKRIVSVGDKLSPEVLKTAKVYQGNGRTLMSGLCDAHTHFTWTNADSLDGLAEMETEEHTLFTARSARTFLDCGYTMCLGAASAKQRLDMVIRNAINAGEIPGPRSLANGQEMAPADGALIPGITKFVDCPDDIVATVDKMAKEGVDSVKFSMSGEEILENLRAEDTTFPDDMVAAGVEAAHANGIRVCSHARSDESIIQCLQYGIDIIYHASFVSDSTMYALEAQKDRIFVAPALNFPYATIHEAEAMGYPVPKAEYNGYAREIEVAIAGLKEMKKRGIKVLPGGDYGFARTPHGTYRDMEHFVNLLDFTPMEAILSATALGGEIMLHPHELGKVQPGYYADLLLVNGNPLDDISILSHKENLDIILINGCIHKDVTNDPSLQYEAEKSLVNGDRS